MFLRSLYLKNFRCFQEQHLQFSQGINWIWGKNARGKTSILEAIHLLISGRSFRTTRLIDLIKKECDYFYIEAEFVKHDLVQTLKFSSDGKSRVLLHNNHPLSSTFSLLGLLSGVLFEPDDLALIKGSPERRRHFLDLQLCQADPLYVHHLMRYHRALRQRNHLLRTQQVATLPSWEMEMAHAAAYLTLKRNHLMQDLHHSLNEIHPLLGVQQMRSMQLNYKTQSLVSQESGPIKDYFVSQWEKLRPKELKKGFTLEGPQKDDLGIFLNGDEVRFFASEGEQRCCVAALRLAEWKRLESQIAQSPLLLIDDIGVSLDQERKTKLLDYLSGLGQVFVTTTESAPTSWDGTVLNVNSIFLTTESIEKV